MSNVIEVVDEATRKRAEEAGLKENVFGEPETRNGVEFWIANKIRELRDRVEGRGRSVGVVTGKREIALTEANLIAAAAGKPGPTIQGIFEQALPYYRFQGVRVADGEIDASLAGLVITQPGEGFSEEELRRVDRFLMRGSKALVVLAGAVNVAASDASMRAVLNTWGLERLLGGYGIEMKNEAILDWTRSLAIPVQMTSGWTEWFRAPGIIQLAEDERLVADAQMLDTSFAGFFRISEIAFPFTSPLIPHPERQPEARLRVVARSSPKATVDASGTIEMNFSTEWKPKGEYASRVIAIVLEGKIPKRLRQRGGRDPGPGARGSLLPLPRESVRTRRQPAPAGAIR